MEPDPSPEEIANQQVRAKNLQKLFDEKKLDLFLQQCQDLMKNGVNLREFSQKYKLQDDMQEQYHSMKRVTIETERIVQIAKAEEEGWKHMQMNEKCTVSVRANSTLMELKSTGQIDVSLKNMLIVAFLIKNYKECVPFCKESVDLAQPTKLQKIGFLRLSIPIPFIKDRSCILRGIGFQMDHKKHKVYLYAQGVTENKQYCEKNNIDHKNLMKNRQLLDIKHFAVEMTCIGADRFTYSGYALIDHHIPLLPQRLIVFVAKEIGKHVFKKLLKDLQKFDQTVWGKQLKENYKENEYFYDWINQSMNRWVQEIQAKL